MTAGNKSKRVRTAGESLIRLAGILAILAAVGVAGLFVAGWANVQTRQDTATIEIKTSEIELAADAAATKGQQLWNDAFTASATDAAFTTGATRRGTIYR